MGRIILITGGARSGKSRFAEEYAKRYSEKHGGSVAYIATAEVYDDEMAFRVKLHRKRRPSSWTTFEAPKDADKVLDRAKKEHNIVLFDCLTIYVSNMLCDIGGITDSDLNYRTVMEKIGLLMDAAKNTDGISIFVTNEVGAGIVPANHLSREYRDVAGIANQYVAKKADEVWLVACGLPINIKEISKRSTELWQSI